MRAQHTVSVVVPLFDKERTVARALASVVRQAHAGVELIVVNDGSRDRGALEVTRFAEAHPEAMIRLVEQENRGPGAARNRGLRLARGHWVCFLDADDEWGPGFLATAFDRLALAPDSDVVVLGHYRMIGGNLVCHEKTLREYHATENVRFVAPSTVPLEWIKHFMDAFHSGATLCRTEVIRRYGGFLEKDRGTFGEDLHLWLQVALNHPLCIHPKSSMIFHVDDSELSGISSLEYWPTWPLLLDPEPIRRTCGHHEFLEEYLAAFALVASTWRLRANEPEKGLELLERFPACKQRPEYGPLHAELVAARLSRAG
jgi:glycosyltransferase involved in cell wall biosynthesis